MPPLGPTSKYEALAPPANRQGQVGARCWHGSRDRHGGARPPTPCCFQTPRFSGAEPISAPRAPLRGRGRPPSRIQSLITVRGRSQEIGKTADCPSELGAAEFGRGGRVDARRPSLSPYGGAPPRMAALAVDQLSEAAAIFCQRSGPEAAAKVESVDCARCFGDDERRRSVPPPIYRSSPRNELTTRVRGSERTCSPPRARFSVEALPQTRGSSPTLLGSVRILQWAGIRVCLELCRVRLSSGFTERGVLILASPG